MSTVSYSGDVWRADDWTLGEQCRELRAAWQRLETVVDELPDDGAGSVVREVCEFLAILDQEMRTVLRQTGGVLVAILPGLARKIMAEYADRDEAARRRLLTAVANSAVSSYLDMGDDEFRDGIPEYEEAYRGMLSKKDLSTPDEEVCDDERTGILDAQVDRLRKVLRDVGISKIDDLIRALSACVKVPDLRAAASPIVRAVMDGRVSFFDKSPKVEGDCPTVESAAASLAAAS